MAQREPAVTRPTPRTDALGQSHRRGDTVSPSLTVPPCVCLLQSSATASSILGTCCWARVRGTLKPSGFASSPKWRFCIAEVHPNGMLYMGYCGGEKPHEPAR